MGLLNFLYHRRLAIKPPFVTLWVWFRLLLPVINLARLTAFFWERSDKASGILGRSILCRFLQCKDSKLVPFLTPLSNLFKDSTTASFYCHTFFFFCCCFPPLIWLWQTVARLFLLVLSFLVPFRKRQRKINITVGDGGF